MTDAQVGIRLPGRLAFAAGAGFAVPLLANALLSWSLGRSDLSAMFATVVVGAIGLGCSLAWSARGHAVEAAERLGLEGPRLLPDIRLREMLPGLACVVGLAGVAALLTLPPMAWATVTVLFVYWAFASVHEAYAVASAGELHRLKGGLESAREPDDQARRALRAFERDLYGRYGIRRSFA